MCAEAWTERDLRAVLQAAQHLEEALPDDCARHQLGEYSDALARASCVDVVDLRRNAA